MRINLNSTISKAVLPSLLFLTVFLQTAGVSLAECKPLNIVKISAMLPNYSFWKPVGNAMAECGAIDIGYSDDVAKIGTKKPGQQPVETILGVSTTNIAGLMESKSLMELDDLIDKYGQNLAQRQLVKRDGKIVAIAIAANAQNLLVHEDLFKREKLDPPKTWSDLLDTAQKLVAIKATEKPFAIAYKDGWNVANEFVNLYLGDGGIMLDDKSKPSINNDKGVAALNQMVALLSYLPEKYEEADTDKVLEYLLKGEVVMASLWASSAASLDNPAVSRVPGRMKLLPLPAVSSGGKPAGTLWWDGFAISAGATQQEAEAAFRVALEGIDEEMMNANREAAIWLMKDYRPGRLAEGVIASIELGLPEYPASPAMGMLHKALGVQIPKFLKGEKTAGQALADSQTDYLGFAREEGLVN